MECPKCKNTRVTDSGECSRCGYKFKEHELNPGVEIDEFTGRVKVSAEQKMLTDKNNNSVVNAEADHDAKSAAGQRLMLSGALWCIGGIIVTAVSYNAAASSPTGGHYLIAWGAIAFGFYDFIRGLFVWGGGRSDIEVNNYNGGEEICCSECKKVVKGDETSCPHCGVKFE
jgi:RNA polymerase subunit RPABC4/transcription elongation factor Spt4